MNLLALTGALITASASVTTGSLKMDHHQNKMMEVNYKYQSNVVDSWDDLIEDNVYLFNFYDWDLSDMGSNIGFKLIPVESYGYELFDFDENVYNSDEMINSSSLKFLTADYSSGNSTITFYFDEFNGENYLAYLGALRSNSVFIFKGFSFPSSDLVLNNFDPVFIQYTDYNEIVPSNEHRGNLYTTIYDFFYGVFDTSDTNELSMTIMGQEMNLTSWLAHTVTIVLLLLGVLWLILVVRWIFRVFSGLVKI